MLVLGISDSHDASVTLIKDGKIIAAVSEERFTRRKRQQGFPYRSLEYIRGFLGGERIESVYLSGRYGRALFRLLDPVYSRTDPNKNVFSLFSRLACWVENTIAFIPFLRELDSEIGASAVKRRLSKEGIRFSSFFVVEHHYAHIISALFGMDSDRFLALSLDAYGDALSGVALGIEHGKVRIMHRISSQNSIAQFYAYICAYLGFKEGEEGKVMALADFGRESPVCGIFKSIFKVSGTKIKVYSRYKRRAFFRQLRMFSKQDIAFALQRVTEQTVLEFLGAFIKGRENLDLFLSGGLFANIKVTQRLHEMGCFNRIFVSPNMGDGGLSFAPIMHVQKQSILSKIPSLALSIPRQKLLHVYLGPEFTGTYIEDILKTSGLFYNKLDNIEQISADLLAKGKVVARFHGRMEFGPRALGNRSILYQTTDITVRDWLNKKLIRDEFMPFAPVTLFEYKDKCYKNIRGLEESAKFMTVSVNCTDWMKKISPAVVHVDGTARPQLIKNEDNASFYKILEYYHKLTGIPSLINTSFNLHGEPIVCSPLEAIRTFKTSGLDYLAIGNFLAQNLS